jgi:hypothetical protein
LAYKFFEKEYNLSPEEISRPAFQDWLHRIERSVVRPGGTMTHSTGTLMDNMVLRGPSQYDCVLVYENLAIGYLKAATESWGPVVVDYPEPNIWNEHPYYILDVPWDDARQRAAAGAFLKYLMSEPIQHRAIEHGFRPGNRTLTIRNPDSPFVRFAKRGVRIEPPRMCEPPSRDVVHELLSTYGHGEGRTAPHDRP